MVHAKKVKLQDFVPLTEMTATNRRVRMLRIMHLRRA
jgi:hypothetical protein